MISYVKGERWDKWISEQDPWTNNFDPELVGEGMEKFHNEELDNMSWSNSLEDSGEHGILGCGKSAFKMLTGKPTGLRPLGGHRHICGRTILE